jgi:hypothetical protein
MYRMVCRICGISVLMSAVSASALAAGIGTVVDVVNEGYRTPPGASEVIARPTDEVVQGEALRTGIESAIHVQFVDGSELSVEAESEILLSDYVFEPASGADAEIQLTEGLFHFDSNGAEDSGIELHTPVATIGIRGTEFLVSVAADATVVDILDGAVEITPKGGGKAITCEGGQSALVAGSDADAVCGDFGSFSTAAGAPPGQTDVAQGRIGDGGPSPGDRPGKSASGGSAGGGSGGGNSGGGDPGGGDPGGGDPGGGDPGGGDPGGGDPGGGDPGGGGGNSGGNTNHSGLGDGSNPGKGHDNGNGNSGGNGGSNNPGGGKK